MTASKRSAKAISLRARSRRSRSEAGVSVPRAWSRASSASSEGGAYEEHEGVFSKEPLHVERAFHLDVQEDRHLFG